MSKRIANEKMAEEAKKIKADNENIKNHESLDKKWNLGTSTWGSNVIYRTVS